MSPVTQAYWDPDRKLVEDPEYSNPNCDTYCRLMPDYMNWREDMDYRERQGIDRVIRPTKWGAVEGLSVPGVHDFSSFVSIFLGIPYAQQHVREEKARLRFKVGQPIEALIVLSTDVLCVSLIVFVGFSQFCGVTVCQQCCSVIHCVQNAVSCCVWKRKVGPYVGL